MQNIQGGHQPGNMENIEKSGNLKVIMEKSGNVLLPVVCFGE